MTKNLILYTVVVCSLAAFPETTQANSDQNMEAIHNISPENLEKEIKNIDRLLTTNNQRIYDLKEEVKKLESENELLMKKSEKYINELMERMKQR